LRSRRAVGGYRQLQRPRIIIVVANASGLSNCRAPTRTPSEALAGALPPVLVFGQIAFVIVVVTLIGSILLGQPVEYRAECAGKPRAGRFVAFIYRRDSLRGQRGNPFPCRAMFFFEAEFDASAESNAEQICASSRFGAGRLAERHVSESVAFSNSFTA
jgi:hypothetical protein